MTGGIGGIAGTLGTAASAACSDAASYAPRSGRTSWYAAPALEDALAGVPELGVVSELRNEMLPDLRPDAELKRASAAPDELNALAVEHAALP